MAEGYVIEIHKTFNKYFDILREHGGMYDDNGKPIDEMYINEVVLVYHNPDINDYNVKVSIKKIEIVYPKGNPNG